MKLYNNFSLWVFGLICAWWVKLVPFSPLFLILTNLIWVGFHVSREYDFNFSWIALVLVLMHAKPAVLFYKHGLDIAPSVAFFVAYNAFLLAQGTNIVEEYRGKYDGPPESIKEFIHQA